MVEQLALYDRSSRGSRRLGSAEGRCHPEVVADFHASRDFGYVAHRRNQFRCRARLELPADKLESYLRDNIDFSLDEENRRGLELYFTHAAKLGLIPQAKPSLGRAWTCRAQQCCAPFSEIVNSSSQRALVTIEFATH